ncbi:hypothetical protein BURK1_00582 [Burkholderiales bacterium]|nr:hypothetical protein BURK1_00582 [Burkholderiales bacterium]
MQRFPGRRRSPEKRTQPTSRRPVRLLIVGALSWNPERIRSLHERGHRLWGLWSRSMAWDQGPYPSLDGCVTPVALADAARTLRDEAIDAVYSLYQVYHPRLWGAPAPGVEHGVWTLLRALVDERRRGAFDAPILRHWGFDVQNLAPDVVRSIDGHLFCNRAKERYWRSPVREGGCGVDAFDDCGVVDHLDGDRPKLEFMNDDFSERLSERDGEIHTVCIGRPFGIDYLAAARRGIHVHVYGNAHDDVTRTIARDLPLAVAGREAALLRRHIHLHPSLQAPGAAWEDVRRAKSAWVREFSRYDAGWSYVGRPLPWEALDDRAAIPSKVATCLAAGLPVIGDVRPGWHRYDELVRLGVNVDLDGYDALRGRLDDEVRTRERSKRAVRERAGYSFDASIDALVAAIERARECYFARPHRERARAPAGSRRLVHFTTSPDPRALARSVARRIVHPPDGPGVAPSRFAGLAEVARDAVRRLAGARKATILAAGLRLAVEPAPPAAARVPVQERA